jgi:hypothetical protein
MIVKSYLSFAIKHRNVRFDFGLVTILMIRDETYIVLYGQNRIHLPVELSKLLEKKKGEATEPQ